jgi:translation initiation factor RLI1
LNMDNIIVLPQDIMANFQHRNDEWEFQIHCFPIFRAKKTVLNTYISDDK